MRNLGLLTSTISSVVLFFLLLHPPRSRLVHGVAAHGLPRINIVRHIKLPAQVLRSNERQHDNVGIHAAHEDANDLAVVIARLALGIVRQREALANPGLNGRRGRRDQVSKLVRSADDKGAEGAGRQLHKMNGDDAPGALDAKLLEKGSGHDGLVAHKGVRVEQGAADDAAAYDAEAAADRLAGEAHDGAAQHGAQVGHHLRHRDLVLAELELVLQHRRVQVLAAVAHEVEARHEEHEVHEEEPVSLERHLALLDEDFAHARVLLPGLLAKALALAVGYRLGQHESEDDEEDGRAGAEPEQRAPAVRSRVDEAAGKGGTEEIAECILKRVTRSASIDKV